MAHPDDTRRTATTDASNAPRPQNSNCSRTQTSPQCQRLQGESSSWSPSSSPKLRRNHDHDDHGNHHNKKSVFMKVKEKARKLKKSLSGRKRREENELRSSYVTPPGSAGPAEDERSEYFGSPLCEPLAEKEHPQDANKASSEKHNLTSNMEQKNERQSTLTRAPSSDSNDTVPKNDYLAETTDSKLSGLTISTREGTKTRTCDDNKPESSWEAKENARSSSPQQQDKGVSVKEYLMHKFEPGEDERALSQVIMQTISPRCEKVKEAMNSFLKTEEPSQPTSKTANSELDISPAASNSNQNIGDTLSTKSPNMTLSSLSSSPNPNSCETIPSNASNTAQSPASTSSTTPSNLKPNSDPNHSNSNTDRSSSPSVPEAR